MTTGEEVLRRLAVGDSAYYRTLVSTAQVGPRQQLDARSLALLQLGGLISSGAAGPVWQRCVGNARSAGMSLDEVVASLVALAPTVGFARVVAAAPDLARALGYDIHTALFAWQDQE